MSFETRNKSKWLKPEPRILRNKDIVKREGGPGQDRVVNCSDSDLSAQRGLEGLLDRTAESAAVNKRGHQADEKKSKNQTECDKTDSAEAFLHDLASVFTIYIYAC